MISICIPTYNRFELLLQSFEKVLHDERIGEIVIVDDHSNDFEILTQLSLYTLYSKPDKVKIFLNEKNLDCYRNKREAVSKASNEWIILLDSDNVIDRSYLDAIMEHLPHDKRCILQPSFARPHFNFSKYNGMMITKSNAGNYIHDRWFETMLNACNFFVNRDEYLRIWDGSIDPVTSDSIYFNYRWLEAGNSIYVVPGMEYEHRVHDGSHYQHNVRRTPKGLHESILKKLRAMK